MSVMLLKVTFEPQDGFAWNVKLGVYVVKPEKRGFMQPWQPLLLQEMNLLKCLFPLLFGMVSLVAQAQPQAPANPLYDPQGRVIPHDGIRETEPPPKPAKQTKASSKKASKAESAAEPRPAKSSKKAGSTKAGSKSSAKTTSKSASKTAAKPATKKSAKPAKKKSAP